MTAPSAYNLDDQRNRGWRERADACAALMAGLLPASASIADIGCGDCKLRAALAPHGPGWRYAGFDLLPQAQDVTFFDVRSDSLPRRFDAAVLLGVTEYLDDIVAALGRLGTSCEWLFASHVLASSRSPSPARLVELGWISHLDAASFTQAFRAAGFEVRGQQMTPDKRTLIVAGKRTSAG